MRTLILTAILTLASDPTPRVAVKVSSAFLFAGNGVTVVCTVPRHPENRAIKAELTNYRSSEQSIEGENSPVTFRFEFKKVPCDVEAAVCTLTDSLGRQGSAVTKVEVKGCESP